VVVGKNQMMRYGLVLLCLGYEYDGMAWYPVCVSAVVNK
jgi:hypothetical protein